MLVKVRLGLKSETAGHARVRPLVGMSSDVLLQNARLGTGELAIRANVAAFSRFRGFGLGLRRCLGLEGFLWRISALLGRFPFLRDIGTPAAIFIRLTILLCLDSRRNLRRRHLLKLFMQILRLAIVVVVVVIVVIIVVVR